MITLKEVIGDIDFDELDEQIQDNIIDLLDKINIIRKAWNKPMIVTSGFRTMEDHIRVYREKGITDVTKIPMKSLHLTGKAIDIYDPNFELTDWCKLNNSKILKEVGLWCEDDKSVKRLHFQTSPPRSGSRWFKP